MKAPRASATQVGLLLFVALLTASAVAADPPRFREAKFQGGELKHIAGVPVLIVAGKPEEIGEQEAVLVGDVARKLVNYPKSLARALGREDVYPRILAAGQKLLPQFPPHHMVELQSFGKRTGIDTQVLVGVNAMVDVYRNGFGCSSLLVEPAKSATGGPLFGRNLDFHVIDDLEKCSLVTVVRATGKHPFAAVGFPGFFGSLSGMNDAGLALATHEVYLSRDRAPMLNTRGVPYALLFRRILEECATIDEAVAVLKSVERTTYYNLALCDQKGCAVAEVTPLNVVIRRGEGGLCACTNHFRTDPLAVFTWCSRYSKLLKSKEIDKIGIADVAKKLDEVNQGRMTFQTMLFEPQTLKLHVAIGSCPSSALPLKTLELAPLLKPSAKPAP